MTVKFSCKSNDSLISDLKSLVYDERELQLEIIHYLKEVFDRGLHLEKGYASLFTFMTEELGYSEGAAGRRIKAMKLIKDVPEVEAKIEKGELSLTVASQIQGFVQKEDKKRKSEKSQVLTSAQKLELVNQLEGTSSRTCEMKLAEIAPETVIPREKTKILTPDKTQILFVASKELTTKIEKLKNLTSHTNPDGSYEVLFNKLVEIGLDKLDPDRREERRQTRQTRQTKKQNPHPTSSLIHIRSSRPEWSQQTATVGKALSQIKQPTPEKATSTPAQKLKTRHIPNNLRDYIWNRDQGQCQFKDKKTGKICQSIHHIQIDHVYPFSLGGDHNMGNLRLLCGVHNRYLSEKVLS